MSRRHGSFLHALLWVVLAYFAIRLILLAIVWGVAIAVAILVLMARAVAAVTIWVAVKIRARLSSPRAGVV
jgi:hypothetical protein